MEFWYRRSFSVLALLLLPFSYVFRMIVALRRWLYQKKILKSYRFPVPIIVVGNIAVGGTGKTPLVVWLAQFLQVHGFQPGIVSRGYGGRRQYIPQVVTPEIDPSEVGDEPVLLSSRVNCPVIVCIDRVAAVKALLSQHQCNVVIADDGLQHYRLQRDIEIAVVDAERELGNGVLLPAGPLREPASRLNEVDFVIRHGLSMTLQGENLVALQGQQRVDIQDFYGKTVHAVAGIGNPERFFAALRQHGLLIHEHPFSDHHAYVAEDFHFSDSLPILMTEKDAVKCKKFADERFWYLPVDAVLDEKFGVELLHQLRGYYA